jgi:energy-coupling factor transport system permease protein
MFNKLDYSYNGEESLVHRLNPVVKILGLIVYVLICFLRFDYILFAISIGVVFGLLLLSNIKFYRYLKVLSKSILVIIAMYIIMVHKNMSNIDIIVTIVEFIFFILYFMMIVYTTTKKDLGFGSAKIVDVFNLIGINFKKITSFITCLYLYPGVFLDTYNEVFTSMEIRGKVYSHSTITDKIELFFKNIKLVFYRTNKKMKSRKDNMKYRLYKSNVKSKYKYRNKLCIFDYIFIIVNIGIVVFYVLKVRL